MATSSERKNAPRFEGPLRIVGSRKTKHRHALFLMVGERFVGKVYGVDGARDQDGARRIVDCVNALQDYDSATELREQRDALLAAVLAVEDRSFCSWCGEPVDKHAADCKRQAALALIDDEAEADVLEWPADAPCDRCQVVTAKEELRRFDGICGACEGDEVAHLEWERDSFGG